MKNVRTERVFLGLGSNIGDRLAMLRAACSALACLPETSLRRCSHAYETAPWGVTGQEPYLNGVAEIATCSGPDELLRQCKAIEQSLGRVQAERYAPRVIDIDILLFGSQVHDSLNVRIPHAHMTDRAFVLVPLAEIAHRCLHPLTGLSVGALLEQCRDRGHVRDTGEELCPDTAAFATD